MSDEIVKVWTHYKFRSFLLWGTFLFVMVYGFTLLDWEFEQGLLAYYLGAAFTYTINVWDHSSCVEKVCHIRTGRDCTVEIIR